MSSAQKGTNPNPPSPDLGRHSAKNAVIRVQIIRGKLRRWNRLYFAVFIPLVLCTAASPILIVLAHWIGIANALVPRVVPLQLPLILVAASTLMSTAILASWFLIWIISKSQADELLCERAIEALTNLENKYEFEIRTPASNDEFLDACLQIVDELISGTARRYRFPLGKVIDPIPQLTTVLLAGSQNKSNKD